MTHTITAGAIRLLEKAQENESLLNDVIVALNDLGAPRTFTNQLGEMADLTPAGRLRVMMTKTKTQLDELNSSHT
jgi:hypothetical protein